MLIIFGKMKLKYLQRFPVLFAQIQAGAKPVCFFDQDGTVTVKSGCDESAMMLHPDVIPAVKRIMAKGGIYVPSSARSLDELKDGYASIPELPFAANDGFVISVPGQTQLIFGNGVLPDYTGFQSNLGTYICDIADVTMKHMGAYFGLFVDTDHPRRADCERFFAESLEGVSVASGKLAMAINTHPMGITMEPQNNRGKDGVIDTLFPLFNLEDPILITAGDGKNDIKALRLAKERNGHAFKVHNRGLFGVPDYATDQIADPNDCVGLLTAIADAMETLN
jgi:Trehalose-phosphatase